MQPADVKKSPVRGERPPRRTKTPEEAYAALTRLCARAEKSESDALRLMRGWGLAESDAQRVLARLVSDRFIDDARYAGAFVREKFRLSGWGEYKIRAALQRKGIARERIDAALAEADRGDTAGRLRRQLERKARTVRHATPNELKAKLVRYGLSLGYENEAGLDAAPVDEGVQHRRPLRHPAQLLLEDAPLDAHLQLVVNPQKPLPIRAI